MWDLVRLSFGVSETIEMQGDGFGGERWWEWREAVMSSKQLSTSWWELLIHSWQIVFSGGCGLMEMGLFLNAVDFLERAELS